MTTYYVNWKDGSNGAAGTATGTAWKTLTYAHSQITSGDVVKVMGNSSGGWGESPTNEKYRETLKITKSNVTFEAYTGHKPEIDGNYGPHLFGNTNYKDSYGVALPATKQRDSDGAATERYALPACQPKNYTISVARGEAWVVENSSADKYYAQPLIRITGSGVTLRGLCVRNSAGRGILVLGSDATVDGCRIDFTFNEPLMVGDNTADRIYDATITDNIITRGSMRYCDFSRSNPDYLDGGPESVCGSLRFRKITGAVCSGNIVAYCGGEGIIGASFSTDLEFTQNIVHTCHHSQLATTGAVKSEWDSNISYFCENLLTPLGRVEQEQHHGPSGMPINEESTAGIDTIRNSTWTNNLVIGPNQTLDMRNGTAYLSQIVDSYIGYNTFVDNGWRGTYFLAELSTKAGYAHQRSLCENNIFLASAAVFNTSGTPGGCVKVSGTGLSGIAVRNNLFSQSAAATPAAMRPEGSNNVYGTPSSPILVNPFARINTGTGTPNVKDGGAASVFYTTDIPDPTDTTFDINNYKLKSNSIAIGAGAPHTALNGYTPAVTKESLWYGGSTRTDASGGKYDIGCHEHDGVDEEEIAAGFTYTLDPTSAIAPCTATLTNTSTSSGSITAYEWAVRTLPSGSFTVFATTEDTTRLFSAAGQYQIRMTVDDDNGLSAEDTQTITIIAQDTGGDAAVGYDVIQTAAPTSTGNFSLTFSCGGAAPVGALMFISGATSAGTTAAGALLGWGMVDASGNQAAGAFAAADNSADSDVGSHQASDRALLSCTKDGTRDGAAEFVSFSANTLTLNCLDAFPAAYLITAVAIYGPDAEVYVANLTLGGLNAAVTHSSPFTTGAMIAFSEFTNSLGSAATGYAHAFGAGDKNATAGYGAFVFQEDDGVGTTVRRSWISSDGERLLRDYRGGSTTAQVIRNSTIDTMKVANAAINDTGAFMYFGANVGTQVKPFTTATSTGNQDIALDFDPALVLILLSSNTAAVNYQTSDDQTAGMTYALVDAAGTYAAGVYSKDNAATSDTGSYSETSLKLKKSDDSNLLAGAVTLGTAKITINWSTVSATARYGMVIAFEGGATTPTIVGPIVAFTADPLLARTGQTITFDGSTTNPNGDAVDSYEWDFGDGSAGTGVTAEHAYAEGGTYTITLTATNGNGTESLTKTGYVEIVAPDVLIPGPYEPLDTTIDSASSMDADPTSETFLTHSHKLDLAALVLYDDPNTAAQAARSGRVVLYWDATNNRLVVKTGSATRYIGTTT